VTRDHHIEKNYEAQFLSNLMLKDKIKKKIIKKKDLKGKKNRLKE
jgi:hypothetical protein